LSSDLKVESLPIQLSFQEWLSRQRAHERRVRKWTDPHQTRTARGQKHPVYDFLFTYYSYRPALFRRWHPGPAVVLCGPESEEFLRWPEYQCTPEGVTVDRSRLREHRRESVRFIRVLLAAMQQRPAFYGCYGMHEWAMVYRQTPEEIRHNAYPLRFPQDEISKVVASNSICCTHFDAFRFFTPPARPLNRNLLSRSTTLEFEQRGCLHANMDLYKWAYKLTPFTPGELIADCFELARDIREVDMRASPYDLRSLGFIPVAVETVEGRAEYERHQREFAERSVPLRAQLIEICDWLVAGRNKGTDT